ncbi:MAG TPA: hypothetical protein VM283_08710 [Armatimonadota bacterium]|nr:hypothetical protein [Armatimonadota bacterium]
MGPFELNESLAFIFVLVAFISTLLVRMHPSNTPRTRSWWGRFLVLLALVLVAETATNVELLWPADSASSMAINDFEHLALVAAAVWALVMSIRALVEVQKRLVAHKEG